MVLGHFFENERSSFFGEHFRTQTSHRKFSWFEGDTLVITEIQDISVATYTVYTIYSGLVDKKYLSCIY